MTTCPVSYDHRAHFNSHADNQVCRAAITPPVYWLERDRWLLLCLFHGIDESCYATRYGRFL